MALQLNVMMLKEGAEENVADVHIWIKLIFITQVKNKEIA